MERGMRFVLFLLFVAILSVPVRSDLILSKVERRVSEFLISINPFPHFFDLISFLGFRVLILFNFVLILCLTLVDLVLPIANWIPIESQLARINVSVLGCCSVLHLSNWIKTLFITCLFYIN